MKLLGTARVSKLNVTGLAISSLSWDFRLQKVYLDLYG